MKLVVPLTMPCTRSTCAAASVSWITRMTGTTPPTAASKRTCTPAARAGACTPPAGARGVVELLAMPRQDGLVRGHDVPAGAHRLEHVRPRRLDAAHQLHDEVARFEYLGEVAAASG